MIQALIVTHGNFGKELLHTAEKISGKQEGIFAISNEGKSVKDLVKFVGSFISEHMSAGETIILTDMQCGSCYTACSLTAKMKGDFRIITGINLAMVLSFITKRDKYEYDELIDIMIKDGKNSITMIKPDDL